MYISATIVTRNEEANLGRALASLTCVDEILVVDCGSTDDTVGVAARAGARVLVEPWRGYVGQKNFAAKQARHEWILSLDADEELSPELRAEIDAIRNLARCPQITVEAVAYDFPRRAFYLGRWIRHGGWYPDRKIRLYRCDSAAWVGGEVHESVAARGHVCHLQGDLRHFTCSSLSDHLRTLDRYTTLAAKSMQDKGRQASLASLLFAPPWTAFVTYVVKLGFLDGAQGIAIAAMAALYAFLSRAKSRTDLG